MDFIEIGAQVGLYFVPFLFSLCFHEYAHGWVAEKLGDNTARVMGRLSMNPLVHADPIGTFVLPIAAILFHTPFFGWANPVPVNERNFKRPRQDMFWVAAAGPGSNILLAIVGAFLIGGAQVMIGDPSQKLAAMKFLNVFMIINLSLAFFNLIPIHPLDGGKVIARFLPDKVNDQLEANQHITSLLLLILFIGGGLRILAYPIFWTQEYMLRIVEQLVM
jgi:Zn-dependent protease